MSIRAARNEERAPVGETDGGLPDMGLWLERLQVRLNAAVSQNVNMGTLEALIEGELKTLGRPILEQAMQKLGDRQPLRCPACQHDLRVETYRRGRDVSSMFGSVHLIRDYGLCPQCHRRFYPADAVLGLHGRAPASPRVQEVCALMVLESPASQAQEKLRRLNGLALGQATMHREARRQGQRALQLRRADAALSKTLEGVQKLSARARTPSGPFTLVLEIDTWNIRERDAWGQTRRLRQKGEEFSRWHWVYTATIFRLDQRGKTASGRTVITERGYVATREGTESFEAQVYAEAILRGLLRADMVLILADGAIWIWKLAQNRFKDAMHRVDYWHIQEHLWTVARDIYGADAPEAGQWIQPLLQWLERRQNGALDVIESLEEMRDTLTHLTAKQKKTLQAEIDYLTDNKDRMDYKRGKMLGQPNGSGAVESTCCQYQVRFKRTGQFWSLEGDEAFLALATLYRNQRWHQLFPHDACPPASSSAPQPHLR
jgi:hypothetical protein